MPGVAQPHLEGGGELSEVTAVELDLWSLFLSSMLHLWNLSPPCCGEQCAKRKKKKKKNTWKPDAIKLLICTSVTLTNAVTTTGHEMDQRRCYSFFFFFFFFLVFCLITIVVMQIVLNSCKLLVFKRYAMKRLRRLYSTVNVSESSHGDSSTHQIIHGDEAADGSSLH